MKVLQVISSVSPANGGPSSAIAGIERALHARGIEVTTVATNDDGAGRILHVPRGVPVATADATRWYFAKNADFYLPSLALARWLNRHVADFDLVHVHALFSFAPVAAAYFARRAGVPYIIRPLGVLAQYGMTQRRPLQKRLSLSLIERPLIERAALIHFTSAAERKEVEALQLKLKSAVVPLGVDIAPNEAAAPRQPHEPFRLLYLSRIDRKKNLEGLLEAFAKILAKGQRVQLNIAGFGESGYVESLERRARDLGVASHVRWLGFVEGERKAAAFADADAFVLTSHSENFGIAVVEALACGLPCLLSTGIAVADAVERAGAGIVVEPNPQSIATGLETLLARKNALVQMSAAARELATRDFSLSIMGERLEAMYRGVLGQTPRPVQSAATSSEGILPAVTPMILTFNEEANIERTLSKLAWARKIIVVDSGSSDRTLEIVGRFPQAVILKRPFDSAAAQCNFGLQHIDSEWVLSLDADYVLSEGLLAELGALRTDSDTRGYRASFVYKIGGRPLRCSLYPGRTVLYRRSGAFYEDDGHTQRVRLGGHISHLRSPIYHDDRKPLSRWFASQMRYSSIEAEHLLSSRKKQLSPSDRIRLLIVPAPVLVLLYTLIVKGGLLDGWPGWFYALQRMCAEVMLSVKLCDRRFKATLARGWTGR